MPIEQFTQAIATRTVGDAGETGDAGDVGEAAVDVGEADVGAPAAADERSLASRGDRVMTPSAFDIALAGG
jgi:hypothetical protein